VLATQQWVATRGRQRRRLLQLLQQELQLQAGLLLNHRRDVQSAARR